MQAEIILSHSTIHLILHFSPALARDVMCIWIMLLLETFLKAVVNNTCYMVPTSTLLT